MFQLINILISLYCKWYFKFAKGFELEGYSMWRNTLRNKSGNDRRTKKAVLVQQTFEGLQVYMVLVYPLTCAVRRINNSTQKYLFLKFATNCSIFSIFFALTDPTGRRKRTWSSMWFIWFGLWWPPPGCSSSLSSAETENASDGR